MSTFNARKGFTIVHHCKSGHNCWLWARNKRNFVGSFLGRRGKPNIYKHRFGAVTLAEQRLQGLSIPKSGDDPDAVDILIILYYL